MAYHASEWNIGSIGVELCNRGDAKKEPNYYSSGKYGPKRDVKPCKINGHTILAFDYTPAQYDAFAKLARALQRLLPNLPAEFPQSSAGVQSWDTMPTTRVVRVLGLHRPLPPDRTRSGIRARSTSRTSAASCAARSASRCSRRTSRSTAEDQPRGARAEPTTSRTRRPSSTRRTSSAPTAGSSPSGRGASRGCGTAASTSSAKDGRAGVRAVPGPPRRRAHGRELADRLGQLRAAAPRHGARQLAGPVLLAVHAPRRRADGRQARRVDDEERGWKKTARPARSCCSTSRSRPAR